MEWTAMVIDRAAEDRTERELKRDAGAANFMLKRSKRSTHGSGTQR